MTARADRFAPLPDDGDSPLPRDQIIGQRIWAVGVLVYLVAIAGGLVALTGGPVADDK